MLKAIISRSFESIWKLMHEHTFVVDPDSIQEDFTCGLCGKLMVDACQTPCECQYCYKCITDYLNDGNTHCPGGQFECDFEPLFATKHLLRDQKSNNQIMKLRVLCPNERCTLKMELWEIVDHLRMCKNETEQLCENSSKDAAFNELRNEIYSHTESTMDNMKNEFGSFKESLERNRLAIEGLKQELRLKDVQIAEIEVMKGELREKDRKISLLESQLQQIRVNGVGMEAAIENVSDLEATTVAMFSGLAINHGELERKLIYYTRFSNLCPKLDLDFAWKFDNLSLNKGENKYSETFVSNNYTMRLGLALNRDKIALWCYIIMGVNDDIASWPMKHKVTLSILDQESMESVVSESFDYDSYNPRFKKVFHRPLTNITYSGIGSYTFVRKSDIEPFVDDDSIVVSCKLSLEQADS